MIGVTAAASAFLYYGRGEVRPALTAATVLGALFVSALGAALSHRIHGRHVQKLFAVLLLTVAGQILYRAWSGG
ncbi:MAG: TSUP family transporter [Rhodopirellula sp.]|nr:TSUP family transporter [Rhodopirellula sp.]